MERQRATGECDCGAVIYGFGVCCDSCNRLRLEWREDNRPRDVRDEGIGGKR